MEIQDYEYASLIHARGLISQVHLSCICTETQITPKLYSMDYRNLVMLATMGLAIICQALREATHTSHEKPTKEAVEAYAFIQGTGLDITIQKFALDLNASSIRYYFNQVTHVG